MFVWLPSSTPFLLDARNLCMLAQKFIAAFGCQETFRLEATSMHCNPSVSLRTLSLMLQYCHKALEKQADVCLE